MKKWQFFPFFEEKKSKNIFKILKKFFEAIENALFMIIFRFMSPNDFTLENMQIPGFGIPSPPPAPPPKIEVGGLPNKIKRAHIFFGHVVFFYFDYMDV